MSIQPEEPCRYCGHPYSLHFSDDIRGVGSKDLSQVHTGCTHKSDDTMCQCPGFRPSRTVLGSD